MSSQIGKKIKIDDFMEYYNAAQWKDKNNLQINWKQKVITWEKHHPTKKEDEYESYWKD